ncbi:MAG: energy-coupling factor transporter transmembrane component T [Solirubrobacteraceae bacterium]
MAGALAYRRLPSPLHAARASAGAAWSASLLTASVLLYHPLALAAIALAALLAGQACGVGRQMRRCLRFALWVALPIVIVNVFVSRQGLTVFWRLGSLGPFGQGHLTVEALVYGATIALKLVDVILVCTLATLAVDPDQLLGLCRRLSFRSALTAALALRMVPLLAADAQRLAEAQRTRARAPRGARAKALLLGATAAGALDRSLDVAATLELRGLAARRPSRALRSPVSRHDLAFACSGLAVLALALLGALTPLAAFDPYPLLHLAASPGTALLCAALLAAALLPFLDRRGVAL